MGYSHLIYQTIKVRIISGYKMVVYLFFLFDNATLHKYRCDKLYFDHQVCNKLELSIENVHSNFQCCLTPINSFAHFQTQFLKKEEWIYLNSGTCKWNILCTSFCWYTWSYKVCSNWVSEQPIRAKLENFSVSSKK